MAMRAFFILACLGVLSLTSCTMPAARPAPAVERSCAIESGGWVRLDDGTELRIWNLKANGLRRLTARLLVVTDGKAQVANEVEINWDEWEPASSEASGQLVLLIQDGKVFGAKDKRLPQIGLDVQGSPPQDRFEKKMTLLMDGDLHSELSRSSYSTPVGEEGVLHAQLFVPQTDAPFSSTLGWDLDSFAATAKEGRAVVAVTLGWAPQ